MKYLNRQRLLILLPPLLLLLAFLVLWFRADLEARKWTRQGEELRRRALSDPETFGGPRATILQALRQGQVEALFTGSGRGPLQVRLSNLTPRPLGVAFEPGQAFLSRERDAQLLIMREQLVLLPPGEQRDAVIPALAGTIYNDRGEHSFLAGKHRDPRLEPLWQALEARGDLADPEIAQAALLLLRENLPLAAVARFDLLGADRPAVAERAEFFYTPRQLISAVALLREAGHDTSQLAVLVDPQFQLETLLDPQSRAMAQQFFGINSRTEWAFWHDALLEGNELLRPRALLGIGRYYPEVALRMLPQWARFENVSFRYRQAALQGLAEMGTPESGALLKKLRWEFRQGHPLETSALEALAMHEKYRRNPLVPDRLKFDSAKKRPQLADAQSGTAQATEPQPAAAREQAEQSAPDEALAAVPTSSPFAPAQDLQPAEAPSDELAGARDDGALEGLDLVAMAESLAGQAAPAAPPQGIEQSASTAEVTPSPTPDLAPEQPAQGQAGIEPQSAKAREASRRAQTLRDEDQGGNQEDGSGLDFAGMAEALAAGEPVTVDESLPNESAEPSPAPASSGPLQINPSSDTQQPPEQSSSTQLPAEEDAAPEEEILRLLGLENSTHPPGLPLIHAPGMQLFTRGIPAILLPDFTGSGDQLLMSLWLRISRVVPLDSPATAGVAPGLLQPMES